MRYGRFIILIVTVAVFLSIRQWLDRKRERMQEVEIIREDIDDGDTHLGRWAQKNVDAWIQFRLKRDGRFSYEVVAYPGMDTIGHAGWHQIVLSVSDDSSQFPRLVAVSDNGDTIINHWLYLTRGAKENVDILGLKKDTHVDAPTMVFYRIKQ